MEKGGKDERQHDDVFKVIDEQDSSGNTLLTIDCNNKCRGSDGKDQLSHPASGVAADTEKELDTNVDPNLTVFADSVTDSSTPQAVDIKSA